MMIATHTRIEANDTRLEYQSISFLNQFVLNKLEMELMQLAFVSSNLIIGCNFMDTYIENATETSANSIDFVLNF